MLLNHFNFALMVRRFLYLLLFAVLSGVSVLAQFKKYSNEFLNIGAGARAMAMGNANLSSVDDATAGYWNPSNLMNVNDFATMSIMHADYFAGIAKYDYFSVAKPIQNNKRVLGCSIVRFAVDDIPNTLFLVQPDGSLNYNNIQSFSSSDFAMLLSYAQHFKKIGKLDFNAGANAKIIRRKVGQFAKAWGFGLDASISTRGKNWSAALMARDITTTFNAWSFSFDDREKEILYLTNNDIPVKSTELTAPRIALGGSYKFNINKKVKLLTESSLDFTFDGKRNTLIRSKPFSIDPHFGLEVAVRNTFFVRAGITNFQRGLADADTLNMKKVWISQPSLGAGFKIKNATIDYAFTNLANQQNPLYTHVFSLKFNFIKKLNLFKKKVDPFTTKKQTVKKGSYKKMPVAKPKTIPGRSTTPQKQAPKKSTNTTTPSIRMHF